MPKFMGIDLLDDMEKIMLKNTVAYQSDFEIDRKELTEIAEKAGTLPLRECIYLWMVRPHGTWLLKERDVFLEPAGAHHIWEYYCDATSQRILAYAVEVTGMEGKNAIGNLYPLDYREHVKKVRAKSLPADKIRLVYEKGERFQNSDKRIRGEDDELLGRFQYSEFVPNDKEALEAVLRQEGRERSRMRSGKIESHIRKLAA